VALLRYGTHNVSDQSGRQVAYMNACPRELTAAPVENARWNSVSDTLSLKNDNTNLMLDVRAVCQYLSPCTHSFLCC
jgi:hypothetical protein